MSLIGESPCTYKYLFRVRLLLRKVYIIYNTIYAPRFVCRPPQLAKAGPQDVYVGGIYYYYVLLLFIVIITIFLVLASSEISNACAVRFELERFNK